LDTIFYSLNKSFIKVVQSWGLNIPRLRSKSGYTCMSSAYDLLLNCPFLLCCFL